MEASQSAGLYLILSLKELPTQKESIFVRHLPCNANLCDIALFILLVSAPRI